MTVRDGDSPLFARERQLMVDDQLVRRGIGDPKVLEAMAAIPREAFVPESLRSAAYRDSPLMIGHGQTISQPYMVALMTQALELTGAERVLEIGTGSGYQTAILARLAREVVTVERIAALAETAGARLAGMGYSNVIAAVGDGTLGHAKAAPYDRILVTAGAPDVPDALVDQLADAGILVIPTGSRIEQTLWRVRRRGGTIDKSELVGCIFVPLIGAQGWPGPDDPSPGGAQ